jgi:hypothetical protein
MPRRKPQTLDRVANIPYPIALLGRMVFLRRCRSARGMPGSLWLRWDRIECDWELWMPWDAPPAERAKTSPNRK